MKDCRENLRSRKKERVQIWKFHLTLHWPYLKVGKIKPDLGFFALPNKEKGRSISMVFRKEMTPLVYLFRIRNQLKMLGREVQRTEKFLGVLDLMRMCEGICAGELGMSFWKLLFLFLSYLFLSDFTWFLHYISCVPWVCAWIAINVNLCFLRLCLFSFFSMNSAYIILFSNALLNNSKWGRSPVGTLALYLCKEKSAASKTDQFSGGASAIVWKWGLQFHWSFLLLFFSILLQKDLHIPTKEKLFSSNPDRESQDGTLYRELIPSILTWWGSKYILYFFNDSHQKFPFLLLIISVFFADLYFQ